MTIPEAEQMVINYGEYCGNTLLDISQSSDGLLYLHRLQIERQANMTLTDDRTELDEALDTLIEYHCEKLMLIYEDCPDLHFDF